MTPSKRLFVTTGLLCCATLPGFSQESKIPTSKIVEIYRQLKAADAESGITRSTSEIAKEACELARQDQVAEENFAQMSAVQNESPKIPQATEIIDTSPKSESNFVTEPAHVSTTPTPVFSQKEESGIRPFFYAGPSMLYSFPTDDTFTLTAADLQIEGKWKAGTAWGFVVGGGLYLGDHHCLSLETGAYFNDDTQSAGIDGFGLSLKKSAVTVPFLLSYSYVFDILDDKSMTFKVGPSIGLVYVSNDTDLTVSYSDYYEDNSWKFSWSNNDVIFAGGVNFAYTWNFAGNWFLEISDKIYLASSYSVTIFDQDIKTGMVFGNQVSLSVGAKF